MLEHIVRFKMFTNQFVMLLSVIKFAGVTQAFDFIQSPVNTTGIEGGIGVLSCRVGRNGNGDGPSSSYWTRKSDNHLISTNNDTSTYARLHRNLARRLSILGEFQYEYNMQITNLEVDDTGFYQCWHLDENEFSHYSDHAYLRVLPRDVASWFPSCTATSSSNFGGVGTTVGSTVTYTCQAPTGLALPTDLSLYVKSTNNVAIVTCDRVPCSFAYTLRLADRNDHFVCGTQINHEIYERECTVNQLRERSIVSLSALPTSFVLNSVGTLFCHSADDNVEEYLYQWFFGDAPLTELQSENHYTFPFLSENLNNSNVTCVVNDLHGYVGSSSFVIMLPATTADFPNDDAVDTNAGHVTTQHIEDAATGPPFAPAQDKNYAMEKIFGIPMEVLLFFSSAIVVLLLLLIIIILLIQRQKKSRVEQVNRMHSSELVAIGNAELKVDLSNDVMIASHKQHAISPRASESEDASFYDNVPSRDQYSSRPHSIPYNSNNAKGPILLRTAGHVSLDATMEITEFTRVQTSDYNVLDPSVVSDDDTLDSFDLDNMREKSQRNFDNENTSSQSIVTRQRSLPVNSPSTLYAVTSLISHSKARSSVSNLHREKHMESVSIRQRSASCQDARAEYASPCNRPMSKDFSLSENSDSDDVIALSFSDSIEAVDGVTGQRDVFLKPTSKHSSVSDEYAEITNSSMRCISPRTRIISAPSDRSPNKIENNVIRLERMNDGTEKVIVLDDNKYITNSTYKSTEK